jgi:hypothetical protein
VEIVHQPEKLMTAQQRLNSLANYVNTVAENTRITVFAQPKDSGVTSVASGIILLQCVAHLNHSTLIKMLGSMKSL